MRVALPKGRYLKASMSGLRRLGVAVARENLGQCRVVNEGVEFFFLKAQDCAALVANGQVDFGVAPDEWIEEAEGSVRRVTPVCWSHTSIEVLLPSAADDRSWADPGHATAPVVATPFPSLCRTFLNRAGAAADILRVHGSVEALPGHIADLALDCVETGATAAAHGLRRSEVVFRSDVWLVSRPDAAPAAERQRWLVRAFAEDPVCAWSSFSDRSDP